jgi:ADP-heptose:LPS heptosyltransferase
MSTARKTESKKRILLVRLGGFGDVIFTLPSVHLVRTIFPEAEISFLVYKEFASLLEGFPGVDTVLTLDRMRFRSFNPLIICAHTSSLLSRLTRARFALAIDFQGFGETAFLSWFTRAPQRWGSVYRPRRKWAYTRGVARDAKLHPIDYNLDLLRQAGGLERNHIHNEFVLPEKAAQDALQFFSANKLSSEVETIFIQPFTSTPHKTWALEHFIQTARLWQKRGVQVLFGGGPGDKMALAPASQAGFPVAAGGSPLFSAGLVNQSTLVLGGDTGLLHLAVAMRKRVIMIMRSVQPGDCFPFGHREWAITPSPGLNVSTVKPESVMQGLTQAMMELAGKWNTPS